MKNKLIQEVLDVRDQRKSGLLLAVTTISADADADSAIRVLIQQPEFSFFFKNGGLASVMCRGIQGGTVIARSGYIGSVIRTQWTAIEGNAIPMIDTQLSTRLLLAALGVPEVTLAQTSTFTGNGPSDADAAMELRRHSEAVFQQILGSQGAAILKDIHARFNPHLDRKGFVQACVAELAPLLGHENARSLMTS